MTDQNIHSISTKSNLLVVGVCKYDYKQLGYVDVFKIAKNYTDDPHFLQILVRKVSPENWGIQFIFTLKRDELPEGMKLWQYFHNTYDKLFAGTYATDIVVDSMDGEMGANWLIQKPFVIEKD